MKVSRAADLSASSDSKIRINTVSKISKKNVIHPVLFLKSFYSLHIHINWHHQNLVHYILARLLFNLQNNDSNVLSITRKEIK